MIDNGRAIRSLEASQQQKVIMTTYESEIFHKYLLYVYSEYTRFVIDEREIKGKIVIHKFRKSESGKIVQGQPTSFSYSDVEKIVDQYDLGVWCL